MATSPVVPAPRSPSPLTLSPATALDADPHRLPALDETEWEFWQATENANGSWSACWGGKLNMATSDGVFPYPFGETGSGIANLATEVTEADVASGSIDHAIAMEIHGDQCDRAPNNNGAIYPADRSDCEYNTADWPSEGTWLRFPANEAPLSSGLTPFGQMIFKAIQTYGAVIVDQGGAVAIEADQTNTWAAEGHSGTDPITASMDGVPYYKVVASLHLARSAGNRPSAGLSRRHHTGSLRSLSTYPRSTAR